MDAGVSEGHRDELVMRLEEQLWPGAQSEDVKRALGAELERLVELRSVAELETRRMVAFVGPSGTGKTTAVQRTAAMALEQQRTVGLIALDPGDASVEQLRGFVARHHLPLEVVRSRSSLRHTLARLEACDLLLIDTASCSPRREDTLKRLGHVLLTEIPGVSCELCISATTSLANMRETLERYHHLNPENLLVTKLDETFGAGRILSAHLDSRLPLSLFTTGPDAPGFIEYASVERLLSAFIDRV